MLAEVQVVVHHHHLAILADDVGRAGGDPGMLGPGDIIALLDFGRRGRNREGAAAFLGREIVQRLQIVAGHSDDLRPGLFEVADRLAEGMCLGGAAAREGLGEEIKNHGALLQLVSQVKLELLASDGARRREVGSCRAKLERRASWSGGERGSDDGDEKLAHWRSPWGFVNPYGRSFTAADAKVREGTAR